MQYEVFSTSMDLMDSNSTLQVEVDTLAPIFAEHFPGYPIVPAAFTVGFVLACCRTLMPGKSFQVKRVVFTEPITPGLSLQLQFTGLHRSEPRELGFTLSSSGFIHCRGSVMYV
ncbi:hypothetical protein J4P02_15990 [Pseudomonas sp. NFXW11]|uniref:hypothetical protein n=1 Tax=Pseudomonas sp. NFXW11 TaxID=2819531 RepID=UPI003CFA353C